MELLPLVGHEAERARVAAAMMAGRLPQHLLLTGAAGVGKQRFGLWIAQAVLCETGRGEPCSDCRACRLVMNLGHPDLHWFMPVLRPKDGDAARQVQELEEALAAVLAERRTNPLYRPQDGMAGHFVATARLLQRRAALTPVMGRRKVFLLAEADRLVPQESSPEAANALLKLLEEPPADCQFVLTAVDGNRLLPTIQSRLVSLRLGRLPEETVRRFLAAHAGLTSDEASRRAAEAEGSIGQALALGDERAKAARAAEEFLRAVTAGRGPRAERALRQGTWQARGEFAAMLDALAEALAASAREQSGTATRYPVPEPLKRPRPLESLVEAGERVAQARETARGNLNPQLVLAVLAEELAEVL
jgi:DNA polymerase-3 subunit delta'